VTNLRIAAIFAVAAAVSGWLLASTSVVDDVQSLQWHRWVGTTAALACPGRRLPAAAGAGYGQC
jgi:hypothetical protein